MQIMQLKHQKDGVFFVLKKVFFGIDKVFEIERIKRINEKQTFLCKQSCHFLR